MQGTWINNSYFSTLTLPGSIEYNFTSIQCTILPVELIGLNFNDTNVAYLRVLSEFYNERASIFPFSRHNQPSLLTLWLRMYVSNAPWCHLLSDPPSKPVNLRAATSNASTVVFSWSPSSSPFSAPVTYNVTVEDQHSYLLYSTQTGSTSLNYTIPARFCSVMIFRIHASNGAGRTNISELRYYSLTSM